MAGYIELKDLLYGVSGTDKERTNSIVGILKSGVNIKIKDTKNSSHVKTIEIASHVGAMSSHYYHNQQPQAFYHEGNYNYYNRPF